MSGVARVRVDLAGLDCQKKLARGAARPRGSKAAKQLGRRPTGERVRVAQSDPAAGLAACVTREDPRSWEQHPFARLAPIRAQRQHRAMIAGPLVSAIVLRGVLELKSLSAQR